MSLDGVRIFIALVDLHEANAEDVAGVHPDVDSALVLLSDDLQVGQERAEECKRLVQRCLMRCVLVFVDYSNLVFFLIDILVNAREATWRTLTVFDASIDVILGQLNDFNFFFNLFRLIKVVIIFYFGVANHFSFAMVHLNNEVCSELQTEGDQAELVWHDFDVYVGGVRTRAVEKGGAPDLKAEVGLESFRICVFDGKHFVVEVCSEMIPVTLGRI